MTLPPRVWDPAPSGGRDAAIFFTWMSVAVLLLVASAGIARRHAKGAGVGVGVVLVPVLAALLGYANLCLAVDALDGVLVNAYTPGGPGANAAAGGSDAVNDASEASEGLVVVGLQRLRAATQAFVVPLFLAAQWELNYEVHKRRSANLCCGLIAFDQGHRTSTGA